MITNQPLSRRSFMKKGLITLAGIFASGGLGASYASIIEPRWYEITQVRLTLPRLPDSFRGLRIVQFSDIHIGPHFDLDNLQAVIDIIMKQKPDLICFTGDLFDYSFTENPAATSQKLSQLKGLGQWAVLGNHDYYENVNTIMGIVHNGGFRLLVNEHANMKRNNANIQLIGVDDMCEGSPDLELALNKTDPSSFSLLLAHATNYADIASKYPIDLQLSGHSHGGQVRLPFIGALADFPVWR